jgi:hypothetical protein
VLLLRDDGYAKGRAAWNSESVTHDWRWKVELPMAVIVAVARRVAADQGDDFILWVKCRTWMSVSVMSVEGQYHEGAGSDADYADLEDRAKVLDRGNGGRHSQAHWYRMRSLRPPSHPMNTGDFMSTIAKGYAA